MDKYKYVFDCYDRADDFRVSFVKVTVTASDEEEAEEALEKVKKLLYRQFYCLEEINCTELI